MVCHGDAYGNKGLHLWFSSSPRVEAQERERKIQGLGGVVLCQTTHSNIILISPVFIHNVFTYSSNISTTAGQPFSLDQSKIQAVCQVASSYLSKLPPLSPLVSSACEPSEGYLTHCSRVTLPTALGPTLTFYTQNEYVHTNILAPIEVGKGTSKSSRLNEYSMHCKCCICSHISMLF